MSYFYANSVNVIYFYANSVFMQILSMSYFYANSVNVILLCKFCQCHTFMKILSMSYFYANSVELYRFIKCDNGIISSLAKLTRRSVKITDLVACTQ